MKKMINRKIVDTNKMVEIASRTSHYSHSNNPIGWQTLYGSGDMYYLHTCGGNDIFAPDDNIELIGDLEKLIEYVDGTIWATNSKLIEHIESTQVTGR